MLTAFWWCGIIWWQNVTTGSVVAMYDFMLYCMWQSIALRQLAYVASVVPDVSHTKVSSHLPPPIW